MKLIVIRGPSGSGKSTLSKIILNKFRDGIILNTDNYYKTGIKSQILSKIVPCYFDRLYSFNDSLFKQDLNFILKNGFSNFSYEYNFRSKSITKTYKKTEPIKFIVVEGIFGQQFLMKDSSENNYIFIDLKTVKETCMRRVIKRDYEERGKNKNRAKKDFIKAWELFHKNNKNSSNNLEKFNVKNKSDINSLLLNLTNLLN